jgi:transposase
MLKFWDWRKRCLAAEAENTRLQEQVVQLEVQVQALTTEVMRLTQALAAAHKHSGNSSKPPSSDLVKPTHSRRHSGKRKKGGQPGHPRHEPPTFPPDQIDAYQEYRLEACPVDPTHRLVAVAGLYKILQQVELVDKPVVITEHIAYGYWCKTCRCYHYAPFPEVVRRAGWFGPRLTSLVCYLKGKLHSSYSGIADLCDAVLGVPVSRGYLAKLLQKGTQAFAAPCTALVNLLPQQRGLNIDETGHKENGHRQWIWCFRAVRFVVFLIRDSRGAVVLEEVLGQEFAGILGADFWGAYRKYARQCGVLIQFCLAHLVREVKYLCEFPQAHVQRYGQGLLAGLRVLFTTLHCREQLEAATFEKRLAAAQAQIWTAALDPQVHPERYGAAAMPRLIQTLVKRFAQHGEGYFQFIIHPEIAPTNNTAEQAMRFVVMDRHVTQGTRSPQGRQVCERLWTVIATCAVQQRSAFAWMSQAIHAHLSGQVAPSLLVNTS